MAVKISEMTELAAAASDIDADFVAIVDTSATETKKITPENMVNDVLKEPGPIGGTTPGAATFSTLAGDNGDGVLPITTPISMSNAYHWRNYQSLADDAEVELPASSFGFGTVVCFDGSGVFQERTDFSWESDGTVNIWNSSTNVAAADTDTNLCVYDNGSNAAIKNRLGATRVVLYTITYFTP